MYYVTIDDGSETEVFPENIEYTEGMKSLKNLIVIVNIPVAIKKY